MKEIEFITDDPLILQSFAPKPAKDFLPKWYSDMPKINLKESEGKINIRNCLPVEDMITAGYILFNSYQIHLEEKFVNFQNALYMSTMKQPKNNDIKTFVHAQCPFSDKPRDKFKIKIDWKIKTPSGYSCLIQQPPYLQNSRYQLFPAIVDTDEFDDYISISGTLLDKSTVFLDAGEPLVQIIPFKRDEWKMTASVGSVNSKVSHYLFEGYKKLFHKIKKFI